MTDDILSAIKKEFSIRVSNDKKIKSFLTSVSKKTPTFSDSQKYAQRLGEVLGDILGNFSKAMTKEQYDQFATECIIPMLKQNHDLVQIGASDVQKILDKQQKITLGSVKSEFNQDRAKQIVKDIQSHDDVGAMTFDMKKSVGSFTEQSFANFIKDNASFRNDIGMKVYIVREYEGAHKEHTDHKNGGDWVDCPYCKPLAGKWDYNNLPDDIYKIHKGCHCTVTYVNEILGYKQNTHSKKIV